MKNNDCALSVLSLKKLYNNFVWGTGLSMSSIYSYEVYGAFYPC